jgi:PIN domain nuclease of toxin-antitoxin system
LLRLLLDTHLFVWFLADSPALSKKARRDIDGADEVAVSAASIWEIAIKAALGKITIDIERAYEGIAASGFVELPVRGAHAVAVSRLPAHHRDPFDRLLIAQAISEPLTLLTADRGLARYSPLVRVV